MAGGGSAGGLTPYIWILAILNVAIAMMNLLPLPPLDGGHILRLFSEKIIGKKAALTMYKGLMVVGIIFLVGLLFFATFMDIKKIL